MKTTIWLVEPEAAFTNPKPTRMQTIRLPMPSCPRYQIFISYAHVDNQAEADDLDGWVTHLVRELERRISGQIGRKECVYFKIDHQLNGHEQLDEQIRTAIRESSIFLLIGSNGYLASDWCMNQELSQFLEDFGGERIFIVEKMPYNRAALPRPVANRVGRAFSGGGQNKRGMANVR